MQFLMGGQMRLYQPGYTGREATTNGFTFGTVLLMTCFSGKVTIAEMHI